MLPLYRRLCGELMVPLKFYVWGLFVCLQGGGRVERMSGVVCRFASKDYVR